MGLNNIEKKSTGYELLKWWVNWWHNKIYYSHVSVIGLENIPKNTPLLFTANHQNALMDALVMLLSVKRIMVFVARADIFKNPKIAKILYFLKILPIYRVRDGFETVKKTNDIIKRTVNVIAAGCGMVILPEGNHSDIRKLRPLKKGFARMAFQAEEMNNFELGLQIVPVGIYYNSRKKYRSKILIQYGKPLPIEPFINKYKKNPPVALNHIKDALSDKMRPLIIDIRSKEYYNFYNNIRKYNIFLPEITDSKQNDCLYKEFLQQQKLIEILEKVEHKNPKQFRELYIDFTKFESLLKENNLKNFEKIQQTRILTLLLKTLSIIILTPISIYGFINNALPYFVPIWITNKIKDQQFVSSVKFVTSMILFPFFYILQTFVIGLCFWDWKITPIYLVSLPLTAKLTLEYFSCLKNVIFNWKIQFTKRSREYNEIINLKTNISDILDKRIKYKKK